MTSLHAEGDEPLIPMPALRLRDLRSAVAAVAPSSLPEFFEEMQQAFTDAEQAGSVYPLRGFLHKWALIVAMERHPGTARRLHEAEKAMQSPDRGVRDQAIREIADILPFVDSDVAAN
ncbi:hypothetical protein GCM10027570_21650 [Streptomonospora sediminis]